MVTAIHPVAQVGGSDVPSSVALGSVPDSQVGPFLRTRPRPSVTSYNTPCNVSLSLLTAVAREQCVGRGDEAPRGVAAVEPAVLVVLVDLVDPACGMNR
jgi:hypothetical protein